MITLETWAYIRHRHFQDGLGVSAIARELDLDRKTVRNAIATGDYLKARQNKCSRPSKLDPFKDEIERILQKTPNLSGVRILEKIKKLGYNGSKSILYDYLACLPQRQDHPFLRIETGPGEQAQCDWGKCGSIEIGNTTRHLSCFVMTLSYSRYMYVHFYLSETMECFLDAHLRAFAIFGGIPGAIIYDNLKSVVLARYGSTIHFNPTFMDFAGYHLFKPEPCRPRKPHHKGKVERGVGFVKGNFLAGREHLLEAPFELAFLNYECARWLATQNQRIHATTHKRPLDLLQQERSQLLSLPLHPYQIELTKLAHADSQAFVHFQTNLYSVPSELAAQPLILKVDPYEVKIFQKELLIASHKRSFEKYRVFENPQHRQKVLQKRKKARQNKEMEFFSALDPLAEEFLKGLTQAGVKVPYHIRQIMQMVDIYGKTEVLSAIERACQYGAYHFEYVENIIQQQRRSRQSPHQKSPPLPENLKHGQDIRLSEIDMSQYQIKGEDDDE
jgi:transposase